MFNIFQNKNNKDGGKMKKILLCFLGIFLFAGSLLFVACGETPKAEIKVSSDFFVEGVGKQNYIELSLNGGETTAIVNCKVENANDGRVKVSNNNEEVATVETNFSSSSNENIITITAKSEGDAQFVVSSYSGSADSVVINIHNYSDIKTLSQVKDFNGYKKTQFVKKGEETLLSLEKYLVVGSREGGECNRKEIIWEFGENDGLTIDGFSLKNGTDVVAEIIDNEKLSVKDNFNLSSIMLKATSKYPFNSDYATTNVKFDVVDFRNDKVDNDITYGRNSTSVEQSLPLSLSLVRNNDSSEEKEAYVKLVVNTDYDIEVVPVVYKGTEKIEDYSEYLNITLEESSLTGTSKTYVYKVKANRNVNPADLEVKFDIEYKDYDAKIICDKKVSFSVSDVVDNIVINTSNDEIAMDNENFDVYQNYNTGSEFYLNVQLKPDTVLSSKNKFYIVINKTAEALGDYLVVKNGNKNISFTTDGASCKSEIINNNSNIYFVGGEKQDTLTVTFISKTMENVKKVVKLTTYPSPRGNFEIENVTKNLDTRTENEVDYEISVSDITTTQGLYLDYDKKLPIIVSGLTLSEGKIYFTVESTEQNWERYIEFSLKHINGFEGTNKIKLNAFISLGDVKILIDPTTLSGVSSYRNTSDSLTSLVAKIGSSIKLNYSVSGKYDSLVVYENEVREGSEIDPSWFDNDTLYAKENTINDPMTTKKLIFSFKGKDEDCEDKNINCPVGFDVYIPVNRLGVNENNIKLIAEDSLSVEDLNKSKKTLTFNLRNDSNICSYQDLGLFTVVIGKDSSKLNGSDIRFTGDNYCYEITNVSCQNNLLKFDIQAKTTNGYDNSQNVLILRYLKYETYSTSVIINTENSARVQKVIWENEVESIYLDASSKEVEDRNYVFVNTVQPDNVYNNKIAYKFVPDNNVAGDLISISENIVSLATGRTNGGTGYIYSIPSDAIRVIDGREGIYYYTYNSNLNKYSLNSKPVYLSEIQNKYLTLKEGYFIAGLKEDGTKNYVSFGNIINKIKVIVADGESEATALRIYNEEQLKNINTTKHYILMNDLVLENWVSLSGLTGSISGYVSEDSVLDVSGSNSNVVIKFTGTSSNSFVDSIGGNGKISNLTFIGNVSDAFVAKTNNGTIKNITIDVYTAASDVLSSKITGENAGAIASENTGVIDGALVMGATVEATQNAGGIAGANSGTIENSYVEIYKFTSGNNTIKTTSTDGNVGGIVGSSNGGTIDSCYVYDYTLTKDTTAFNIKGESGSNVGAMIGQASGSSLIENSFAVVGLTRYVGSGVLYTDYKVEDCYISYYTLPDGKIEKEYYSDLTKTNSSKWTLGTNDSKINGGFDYLGFHQSSSINVGDLEINDILGSSIKVDASTGILMMYDITEAKTALTNLEKNILDSRNKISFKNLFGQDSKSIVVISSNKDILDVTSNSIVIKDTTKEEVTLTIYSKKDYSQSKTFKFIVLNTISGFSSNIKNNSLRLQVGKTSIIIYSINNAIYLGSKNIYTLEQDLLKIDYEKTAVGSASVDNITYTVAGMIGSVEATNLENTGTYTLTAKLYVDGIDEFYKDAIIAKNTNEITLETIKGARHIGVSIDEISFNPSESATIAIALETDKNDDDISFVVVTNKDDINGTRLVAVTSGSTTTVKEGSLEKLLINKSQTNQSYVYTITVAESYKNRISETEIFYIVFSSSEKTADNENVIVKLNIETQRINHIDMVNYLHEKTTNERGTIVYHRKNQISSLLSPGKFGYMIVGVDPTYANYEYFLVSSEVASKYFSFVLMEQYNDNIEQYVSNSSIQTYPFSGNIKVTPNMDERQEQYVFRVYVSQDVTQDMQIPLTVKFYDKKGIVVGEQVYIYNVSYQKPAEIKAETTILAKGGKVDLTITVRNEQTISDITLLNTSNGISIEGLKGPYDNEDGTKYYLTSINASLQARVNSDNNLGKFYVLANVSRFINGVKEIEETRLALTLSEIAIVETTQDVRYMLDDLQEFNYEYVFDPEEYTGTETEISDLEEIRTSLKNNGWYYNRTAKFGINVEKGTGNVIPVTDRLYVVNGINEIKVDFKEKEGSLYANVNGKFELLYQSGVLKINGIATTDTPIKLRIANKIYTDTTSSSYIEVCYYYNVTTYIYTDEEKNLLSINSAEGFVNITNNETAENYILTRDITLENYTPIDTSKIASLDGNGYTINVKSFNMVGNGDLKLALFSTVSENTLLRNVRVNYYDGGQINVDVTPNKGYSDIQIAGFAIYNYGIITNCEVVAYNTTTPQGTLSDDKVGLNISYKNKGDDYCLNGKSDLTSEVAGFVINNEGSITNSRVGGESILVLDGDYNKTENTYNVKSVSLNLFNINAQGNISGFVSKNTGVVSSSFAKQINIVNKSSTQSTYTSGFAKENSGRILASYTEGIKDVTKTNQYDYCLDGSYLKSIGYVAGFIQTNSGRVENSYCNIGISGLEEEFCAYSAGFVFENKADGYINQCYSGCKTIEDNSTQSGFSGVADDQTSMNFGTINQSYYNAVNISTAIDMENNLNTGATFAKMPFSEDQFYGFSFASELDVNDGVWFMDDDGFITLTEANQISFSHRESTNSTTQKYPYVKIKGNGIKTESYEYGSIYNPVIIRSAEEFDMAMGNKNASSNMKSLIKAEGIIGTYRLVNDIDLSELKIQNEINLNSTNKVFTGTLLGNGFTIKNIEISKQNDNNNSDQTLGLFAEIKSGSIVNIKIDVVNVTSRSTPMVGALAGKVIGDSCLINIDVTQQSSTGNSSTDQKYGILGYNMVGEVAGMVMGNVKIVNISVTNPIVQASHYNKDHNASVDGFYNNKKDATSKVFNDQEVRKDQSLVSELSFAGGAFGYVDVYEKSSTYSKDIITPSDNDYPIVNIKGSGSAKIKGEVVGGLFGFTGLTTNIRDIGFVYTSNLDTDLISYNTATGGLIGYSVGVIKQAFTEYDADTQKAIENNLQAYYDGSENVERGNMEMFTSKTTDEAFSDLSDAQGYIGGLIGYQKYGKLYVAYSKINVIAGTTDKTIAGTTDKTIAGGVIGRIGDPNSMSWIELKTESSDSYNLSSLLTEVYATGDIKGYNGGKYTAGGIVGSVSSKAKVALTSVNATNFIGISNLDKSKTLDDLGIYAYFGEIETGASIKSILPSAILLKKAVGGTGVSEKHLVYVDKIKYNKDEFEILPYNGYTSENALANNFANLKSLSEFSPISAANTQSYKDMRAIFLGSNNWSTDNWKDDTQDLYPSIKYVEKTDCIYLDQYNIEEVLTLMQYSTKEVRVRGLDIAGTTQSNINLSEYSSFFPIEGFAGRLVGGWAINGEKDLSKVDDIKLIINKAMFENTGSGVSFEDLYVEYDENSDMTYNGGTFISTQVVNGKFDNVTFDYSQMTCPPEMTSRIGINAYNINDNEYAYGLVCPIAQSTSFTSVTIKTVTDSTYNFMKANIGSAQEGKTVYVGLLAGRITQEHKYKSMIISQIDIQSNVGSSVIYVDGNDLSQLYVGLYTGKISASEKTSSVYVSTGDTSGKAKIYIENKVTEALYAGGYIGWLDAENLQFDGDGKIGGKTVSSSGIQISLPTTTGKNYVGGAVGFVSSLGSVSGSLLGIDNVNVTLNGDIGNSDNTVAIGGLFGYIEKVNSSFGIRIEGNFKFNLSKEAGKDGNITASNVYVGGIIGYGELKSNFDLTVTNNLTYTMEIGKITAGNIYIGGIAGYVNSGTNDINVEAQNITTTITGYTATKTIEGVTTTTTTKNYIGGLFGSVQANKFTEQINGVQTDLTITSDLAELYYGIMFGSSTFNSDATKIGNDSSFLTLSGSVISSKNIATAYIGGISGYNSGKIITESKVKVSEFKVGSDADPIGETKSSIEDSYTVNSLSVGTAYVGGFIGSNAGIATITGGKIEERTEIIEGTKIVKSTEIAVATEEGNIYLGGIIGENKGSFTVLQTGTFTNSGLYSVVNKSGNNFIGGLVGDVNGESQTISIGGSSVTTYCAYVDANYFVNAKKVYAGGIIGNITKIKDLSIYNSAFGGALKVYGANSKDGSPHTFGGIVGTICETPTGLKIISQNASFGDYIATYGSVFTNLSSFTFGGIVGTNKGAEISNNYSLTTCNNDRLASTDNRKAIVADNGIGGGSGNLYSHSVCLTSDDNGQDAGYYTAYDKNFRGYGTSYTANLVALISEKFITRITFTKGQKLCPITIGSTIVDADNTDADNTDTKYDTNGVTYYVFSADAELGQVIVSAKEKCKLALIGDAREISSSETAKSFINHDLQQNEIISSLRLNIDINDDEGKCKGGLINQMTDGLIYAVGVYGKMSVGGPSATNIASMVGEMSSGIIDESVTDVNIIYRAKDGGTVAGFVGLVNTSKNAFIRNSYSMGKVTTYNQASDYAFNNIGTADVKITNCYTISQIDWHDYVSNSTAESTQKVIFGTATLENCWYDVNATECEQTGITKKTTSDCALNYVGSGSNPFGSDTDWAQSVDYNYGYPTRKFGFLKQSSYMTSGTTYTQKSWSDSTAGTDDYYIIPNAGKLNQVRSKLGVNYVLTNDLNLKDAGLNTMAKIAEAFSGILDGQEFTIDYGATTESTNPLFKSITGTVKNLRLTNVNIKTITGNVGALAQTLSGGTINNVIASGFINLTHNGTTQYMIGGIVGSASGSILNCKNYVKIDYSGTGGSSSDRDCVGGIVGYIHTSSAITSCVNYAPIQNNAVNKSAWTGGIAGAADTTEISKCGNTNSVITGYTLTVNNGHEGYVAGGIAGQVNNCTISECYNTAMVKAGNKSSTRSYAGGIVGKGDNTTYVDLYNSGVIEALGKNAVWYAEMNGTSQVNISTTTDAITVSANEYVGSYNETTTVSTYKNDGQVIRNGCYNNSSKDYDFDNDRDWDSGTKVKSFGDYTISLSNYQAHITGYDDLGYPTSFCVTAERSVQIGSTGTYIVQNQTIVSKTMFVDLDSSKNGTQTYYDVGKKLQANSTLFNANWSNGYLKSMNQVDAGTGGISEIKIAGSDYAFVENAGGFVSAASGQYYLIAETIDEPSFGGKSYSELIDAGYKIDVSATSTNGNVTTLSCEYNNSDKKITTKYLNKGTGSPNFKYTFTATKQSVSGTVDVSKHNVEYDGDNLKIYIGDKDESEYMIDGESYAVKYTYNGTEKNANAQYSSSDKKVLTVATTGERDVTQLSNIQFSPINDLNQSFSKSVISSTTNGVIEETNVTAGDETSISNTFGKNTDQIAIYTISDDQGNSISYLDNSTGTEYELTFEHSYTESATVKFTYSTTILEVNQSDENYNPVFTLEGITSSNYEDDISSVTVKATENVLIAGSNAETVSKTEGNWGTWNDYTITLNADTKEITLTKDGSDTITSSNKRFDYNSQTYLYTINADEDKINIYLYQQITGSKGGITLNGKEYIYYIAIDESDATIILQGDGKTYVFKNNEEIKIDSNTYLFSIDCSSVEIGDGTLTPGGTESTLALTIGGKFYNYGSFDIEVKDLVQDYMDVQIKSLAETEITIENDSYVDEIKVDGSLVSVASEITIKSSFAEDKTHSYEVRYKNYTYDKETTTNGSSTGKNYNGIIMLKDVDLGLYLSSPILSLKSSIYGDDHFVNYMTANCSLISDLDGNKNIINVNFAGSIIDNNDVKTVIKIINDIGTNGGTVINNKFFGSISIKDVTKKSSINDIYKVSAVGSDSKSFINYSAFMDTYNLTDNTNITNISANYGLIVGFDGKNGGSGTGGNQGQSFTSLTFDNYGIIKAGNGGNGGKGKDGLVKDSTNDTAPTQGTSGGSGGTFGSAGEVSVNTPQKGTLIPGTSGLNGFNGNKGHSGLWLFKFYKINIQEWEGSSTSHGRMRINVNSEKYITESGTLFNYSDYKSQSTLKVGYDPGFGSSTGLKRPTSKNGDIFIVDNDIVFNVYVKDLESNQSEEVDYNQYTIKGIKIYLRFDSTQNYKREGLDLYYKFYTKISYYILAGDAATDASLAGMNAAVGEINS